MLERAIRKGHEGRIAELSAKLAQPEFPIELRYLWRAFRRMRRRKAPGMAGPNPIEWPDIDAFQRNSRLRLAPWEVELIEALDDLYLAAIDQMQAEDKEATVSLDDPDAVRDVLGRGVTRRKVVRTKEGGPPP